MSGEDIQDGANGGSRYQAHLSEEAARDDDRSGTASGRQPALLDLKAQWEKLTAKQKLRAKQTGVALAVGL